MSNEPRIYTSGGPGISRRSMLRAVALGGVAVPILGAAGCSSSSPGGSTSGASASVVRGGTLRAAISGGSTSDTLDCQAAITTIDFARIFQLNEPLIGFDADAHLVPILAESLTPSSDAKMWTLKLRSGVTFHNGKELTADDVIYSFQRIVNPKAPLPGAVPIAAVDVAGMKKLDKLTVQIPCHTPYAILDQTVANYYYNIVPEGYDPKKPVGTGPFMFKSFTPGQQSTFVRNPNYWQNGLPYVDEVVISDFADETAQLNALNGGQADMVNQLSATGAASLAAGSASSVVSPGGGWVPFTMRVDADPFTNVKVRQAFRLMVDREQMKQVVFGGNGTIGNDVFSIYDPSYNHDLPQRQHDPEQAKSLLKDAGAENLSIDLVTSDIAQGSTSMATVFAQQAKDAGVTVNLKKVTVSDFYGPQYLKWVFAQDFSFFQYYLPSVAQFFVPSGPYNETHFNDPTYTSLFNQALKTVDESARTDIVHQMQQIDYEQGGYIIPLFPPVIDGVSTKVHGVEATKTGAPLNNYDWRQLWIG
jgi:peptide/nickel transport system substrate-binding protein